MDLLHNFQRCTKPGYSKAKQYRQESWLDSLCVGRYRVLAVSMLYLGNILHYLLYSRVALHSQFDNVIETIE
ncbi:hypothetical protein [Sinobacterium caligoides]|uniref:hypothetical protein n=1 Tax=Sinobacterium caligoides TaxID=933926 RepID=UPI000F4BC75E|nr:hypothetical protein [Sinobacterium caligoides]